MPPYATNLAPAPLVAMGQHLHPLLQPTSEREKHHNITICLFGYGEQSGVAERLFGSYLVLMEGGLADGSRGRTLLVDTGHIMDKWVPSGYSRSTYVTVVWSEGGMGFLKAFFSFFLNF